MVCHREENETVTLSDEVVHRMAPLAIEQAELILGIEFDGTGGR